MNNELWIYDVIGESFFEDGVTDKSIRDELKKIKKGSALSVHINSPGGSVNHAVAIKTMLDQWKGEVHVQIDGLAASAASYIAMAGDTVTMAEGSLFMIHDPWSMVVGDAAELRKAADVLDKLGGDLQKSYAKKSGLTPETLSEMMGEETWFTAGEAVENGFVDSLVEGLEAAAFVIPDKMGFHNVPQQAAVLEARKRPRNQLDAMKRRLELAGT